MILKVLWCSPVCRNMLVMVALQTQRSLQTEGGNSPLPCCQPWEESLKKRTLKSETKKWCRFVPSWQRKRKERKTKTTGTPRSPGNYRGRARFEPSPCKLNKEQVRRSRAAEHSLQMHFLTRYFPFVTLLAIACLKCQSLLVDVEALQISAAT